MLYIRRGQNPNHIIHVVYQEGTNTQTYNTYYQMGEMGLYQKEGNTQPHYTSCISGGARTSTLYMLYIRRGTHSHIIQYTCCISGTLNDITHVIYIHPTISYLFHIRRWQRSNHIIHVVYQDGANSHANIRSS